jgi:NADH dehydrogenase
MKTVVVVGAGYAGLSACLDLARRAQRDWSYGLRLVLVNDAAEHTYTTQLHSIAVGIDDPEDIRVPLDRLLRPPSRLEVARVEAVDLGRRRLYLRGDRDLRYDEVILAVGSVPEDYGLPGVRRHAHVLTDVESASDLRDDLDAHALSGFGRVVLVGGGLTGVELAAEIKDVYRGRLAVCVLEAGAAIMPGVDPALAAASRRLLESKGVEVRTDVRIEAVHARRLEVAGGPDVAYDVLVWCAGVRANPLIARSGLTVDARGRGLTDAYLRARGQRGVWLAGDCAAFPLSAGGFLAPTAQAAEQAGRAAAANVLRVLAGEDPQPFEPRVRGFFASLGEWEGVGRVGREDFFGLPAIVVKRLIEAHHAFEAGGLHALTRRLWRDGGRLLWGAAVGGQRFEERVQAGAVGKPRGPRGVRVADDEADEGAADEADAGVVRWRASSGA